MYLTDWLDEAKEEANKGTLKSNKLKNNDLLTIKHSSKVKILFVGFTFLDIKF